MNPDHNAPEDGPAHAQAAGEDVVVVGRAGNDGDEHARGNVAADLDPADVPSTGGDIGRQRAVRAYTMPIPCADVMGVPILPAVA